jgi:hypothetical protein
MAVVIMQVLCHSKALERACASYTGELGLQLKCAGNRRPCAWQKNNFNVMRTRVHCAQRLITVNFVTQV